jgi:hypothetical protein
MLVRNTCGNPMARTPMVGKPAVPREGVVVAGCTCLLPRQSRANAVARASIRAGIAHGLAWILPTLEDENLPRLAPMRKDSTYGASFMGLWE